MVDVVADRDGEAKEDDLGDDVERGAEDDVANRPAVFKRAEDEKELGKDVDCGTNEWPEDVNDPKSNWARVFETGELLEGGNRNEKTNTKDNKA